MSVKCLDGGIEALCVEMTMVSRRVIWGQEWCIVGVNIQGCSPHTSPLIVVD